MQYFVFSTFWIYHTIVATVLSIMARIVVNEDIRLVVGRPGLRRSRFAVVSYYSLTRTVI